MHVPTPEPPEVVQVYPDGHPPEAASLVDPPLSLVDPPLSLVEPPSGAAGVHAEEQTPSAHEISGVAQVVQLSVSQAAHEPPSLHWVLRQGSHVDGRVTPRSETSASGLLQLLLLEPPLEPPLLEPPPSSFSLEASSPPTKPLPPLLFDEHATAAPNEPTITAVHVTALRIAAS